MQRVYVCYDRRGAEAVAVGCNNYRCRVDPATSLYHPELHDQSSDSRVSSHSHMHLCTSSHKPFEIHIQPPSYRNRGAE
jgi:hypothetical protein